jgi:hypothetical protein
MNAWLLAIVPTLVAAILGYWWYHRSRQTAINLAQSTSRERGFDNLVAFIDGYQYYLCRQNSGGADNRLSDSELERLRETGQQRHDRGLELLRKHVHKHALIEPALEYIRALYFPAAERNFISDLPWPHEYEACRDFVFEALRVCNQMDRRWGIAKKVAQECERQRQYIQDQINSGITQKHTTTDGVTLMFGDGEAISTILTREREMLHALESCQARCRQRLDDWVARGY